MNPDIADIIAGALGVSRGTAYDLMREALKEASPVQEPVGALILGGVIDTSDGPEYEEWDVEWNTKAVETLQEKLVTSNGVTLMLYTTPPAAQRQWVEVEQVKWDGDKLIAKLKEKAE